MTTDFRALCAELLFALENEGYAHWTTPPHEDELCLSARAALAEPQPPVDGEVSELAAWLRAQGQNRDALHLPGQKIVGELRTAPFLLTRAADLLERLSDGPAVQSREPASVTDQLKHQLLLKAKADLIREVINQALKDTASVHWRVADTGEQIVRVGDLLRWAEQAANNMEKTDDN
jgi:hypothetical protein